MGGEGRDRSSFSDLAKQFVDVHLLKLCGTQTYTRPSPQHGRVATGTYKALRGIIHEAQLEALLVLKGLCQGVTQVVRGQGALPTVLELGENALERRRKTCLRVG